MQNTARFEFIKALRTGDCTLQLFQPSYPPLGITKSSEDWWLHSPIIPTKLSSFRDHQKLWGLVIALSNYFSQVILIHLGIIKRYEDCDCTPTPPGM